MNTLRFKILIVVSILGWSCCLGQADTTQKIIPGRVNAPSQMSKPYVILISIDGFRGDFAQKYHASNILRLSAGGVAAEYMIPSYPSLTFPNHYSLATGLYPAHHGLVDNMFYDPRKKSTYDMHKKAVAEDSSWYGGEPLWVLAEKQKMVSASFYWVGSDAAVQGIRPSYYYSYNELISLPRRLNVVAAWWSLPEPVRPHLISFYFPEVDHQAHEYGPESPQAGEAVRLIDHYVGKLAHLADSLNLPVNFVIVSDHGMTTVDPLKPVPIPDALRDTSVCRVSAGSTMIHVYVKNPLETDALYRTIKSGAGEFDVYLHKDIPPLWHYGNTDDRFNRVGDILLVTRFPKIFKLGNRPTTPGKHGFDPAEKDMHASFFAWGPQIKKLGTIPPFENVNIYPFIAQLLGLTYSQPIDGNVHVLKGVLR
jgi:predicted AlkP superfamily pyrophosphatase or phosphodiesterase